MNPSSVVRLVRADEHVTASPRGAPGWGGLSRNTAPFMAGSLAGPRTTALLAGVILMAGVIGGHAATQTVNVPPNSDAYVTCQVDGSNGNRIGDSTFLSGAVAGTVLKFHVSDCGGIVAADLLVEYDGVSWVDLSTFASADAVPWKRDETIVVTNNSGASLALTLNGAPLVKPVPKTLAPGCFTLLGSQVLGSNTFDDITGRPASDFTQIEVFRYTKGMLNPPFAASVTCSAGIWSPSFPALIPGEAVGIKVSGYACQNGPPQIDVQLLGPAKIGANAKQYFSVGYRNTACSGNAAPVTIQVTGIPVSVALDDVSGGAYTLIPGTSGGFQFTIPSVPPSSHYSYYGFSLRPAAGSFPYNVTLKADSLGAFPDSATRTIQAVSSYDPNDKFGRPGAGTDHFITGSEPLPYEIHFENDPVLATAPAQKVVVTDALDTNLDWSTFALTGIGFDNRIIAIPPESSQHFETQLACTIDGYDLIVKISAGIDLGTGQAYCRFSTLDRVSLAEPTVDIGFLRPEDGTGRGKGFFSFTIKAKSGLADGTVIANDASIVFDTNPAISTPEWKNRLDLSKPVSAVAALPAVSPAAFTVTWSGSDSGSGIASYDIWVSDNGGSPTLWLGNTTATERSFSGIIGHTYQFHSVARDALGNTEDAPATPDASTTANACVPYEIWVSGYGLTGADALMDADPDHDGANNLIEFATNGNPASGASGPRCYPLMHVIGGDNVLFFTLAVRKGAVFAPAAPPNQMKQSTTMDCVVYLIEGTADLAAWNLVVTEATGADAAAVQSALGPKLSVPPIGAGWEWRTFRLAGHAGEKPAAFIRVGVTPVE